LIEWGLYAGHPVHVIRCPTAEFRAGVHANWTFVAVEAIQHAQPTGRATAISVRSGMSGDELPLPDGQVQGPSGAFRAFAPAHQSAARALTTNLGQVWQASASTS